MDRIDGLKQYVKNEKYRTAMELPKDQTENYEFLAQGEYNINYTFFHPVMNRKLVLRVNIGSQMHLEHQVEYEAHALKLLESSGRTPKVLYVDGSREFFEYGILVMVYLPGETLDYHLELPQAAECLADIHSVCLEESCGLLKPENPLKAILEECEEMFAVYEKSNLGGPDKKSRIRGLLEKGWRQVNAYKNEETYRCCINTELNSTNFLVNGPESAAYLIDWEKPLYADPAQDLGHFMAPTTTFWKTDVILTEKEMEEFLNDYIKYVEGRYPTEGVKERAYLFARINCLRGITWCAMAWVEYQAPDKLIFNESTFKKLEAYLNLDFLEMIDKLIGECEEFL